MMEGDFRLWTHLFNLTRELTFHFKAQVTRIPLKTQFWIAWGLQQFWVHTTATLLSTVAVQHSLSLERAEGEKMSLFVSEMASSATVQSHAGSPAAGQQKEPAEGSLLSARAKRKYPDHS